MKRAKRRRARDPVPLVARRRQPRRARAAAPRRPHAGNRSARARHRSAGSRQTLRRRHRRSARRSRARASASTRDRSESPTNRQTVRRGARPARSSRSTADGVHPESVCVGVEARARSRARRRSRRTPASPSKPMLNVLHRLVHEPAHEADDDRRVDAAAQKRAERHVADQPPLDRGGDELAHASRPLRRVTAVAALRVGRRETSAASTGVDAPSPVAHRRSATVPGSTCVTPR